MFKIDTVKIYLTFLIMALLVVSCGTARKAKSLKKDAVSVQITPTQYKTDGIDVDQMLMKADTIKIIDKNKEEQTLMAYRTTDGDIFAQGVLDAVFVISNFKNVAERAGKVDLSFQILVPKELRDSKWQLRFSPTLEIMGEKEKLEPLFITGSDYRKAQLKGYQQYEKFLSRIISDTTVFINIHMLEIFLERNIPQIFAYKNDTTSVSDETFYSNFGVSEREAIEHYTNKYAKRRNENRKNKRASKFAKYVKQPIIEEGIRLDTILTNETGDFLYTYVQTINTRPGLKKAVITMSGEVYEEDVRVYQTPEIGPLDFYISSISSFADNMVVRYKTKVIERRASDNKEYRLDFLAGRSNLDLSLNENAGEILKIKEHLGSLVENQVYDLDSIVITASASPEGAWSLNKSLAHNRSKSITDYFKSYLKDYKDSLSRDLYEINLDSTYVAEKQDNILFASKSLPEDWSGLWQLVENDTVIPDKEKVQIYKLYDDDNYDNRELKLRGVASYNYIKKELYPQLRRVMFNFYMHRKGMVKDTVHTTIIDTTYMDGVKALVEMDYKKAIGLLSGYNDYNTAVAYLSMNMNATAYDILKDLEKNAKVNYLLAIISSRENRIQDAVKYYLESCRENPSYIHRGNLDPEISELIKLYKLHELLEKEMYEDEVY